MTRPEDVDRLDKALRAVRERELDPDSPAGAVLLEFLLRDRGAVSEPVERSSAQPVPPSTPTHATAAGKLASWADVSIDEIGDVFEIGDGGAIVSVSSGRLPTSKADRQRILILVKAAADRIAFGHELVSAKDVNSMVHHYAAFDQNVNKNLSHWSHLLARRGSRGAHSYRVTQPGLERAAEIVRFLVKEEGVVET